MKAHNTKKNRLNKWVSFSLKLGIALCLVPVVTGLILTGTASLNEIEPMPHIGQLLQGILELSPAAIIATGILILLLIPLLQIIIAIIGFSINKNKLYIAISIVLLCILITSFSLAFI